jgi:ATP-dependent Clp protease protease subunit
MTDLAGKKTAYYSYTGLIDSNGVTRIAAALNQAVNNNYDEVYLCISSLGGYVADGVFLYNHVRALPIKITAHNTGSLMSIAVAVFVAAEERYCSAGPFQEALTWERIDSAGSAALAEEARTENILRERASIPDASLQARRFREVYITPAQALEWRLVHGIAEFSLPNGNEIIQV